MEEGMNICLLGNAESSHLQKWARAFAGRKNKVTVFSYRQAEIPGVNVIRIEEPGFRLPLVSVKHKAGKVMKALISLKPDILHAHYLSDYGWLGAWTGFHPLVVSAWGSDVIGAGFINRQAAGFVFRKADCITAASEFLKNAAFPLAGSGNIEIVPFGVDTELFRPGPEKKDPGAFTIGTVKALEKVYGINFLIEALPLMKNEIKNLRVIIVGEGSMKQELKRIADAGGVKVEFAGNVDNNSVPGYLQQMDVFVMPSIRESFGVSALEAASTGIPVVATRTGGIPGVVADNATGMLVQPGNPGEIARAVISLYKNPDKRREMGDNARKMVKTKYEWNVCVEKMGRLYEKTAKRTS